MGVGPPGVGVGEVVDGALVPALVGQAAGDVALERREL